MNIRQAFVDQAVSCRRLGSPLTAHVVGTLGTALQHNQGAVARMGIGPRGFPWTLDRLEAGVGIDVIRLPKPDATGRRRAQERMLDDTERSRFAGAWPAWRDGLALRA